MTETPEPTTQPTASAAAHPVPLRPAREDMRPPRLYVAAAWVVIVAGIVFILSTIFFAGVMVVGISHHCHNRHYHGPMYGPGGPGGPWQYGGPGGPGMIVGPYGPPPGFGPGGPGGPGGPYGPFGPPPGPGPGQSPTPPTPTPAAPSPRP